MTDNCCVRSNMVVENGKFATCSNRSCAIVYEMVYVTITKRLKTRNESVGW